MVNVKNLGSLAINGAKVAVAFGFAVCYDQFNISKNSETVYIGKEDLEKSFLFRVIMQSASASIAVLYWVASS